MINNTIGNNLKKLRIEHDLSQKELGQRLSVQHSTISNWERGKRHIDHDMLKQIASFFKVPLESLYGENPLEKTKPAGFRYIRQYDLSRFIRPSRFILPTGLFALTGLSLLIFRNGNASVFGIYVLLWLGYALYALIRNIRLKKESLKEYHADLEASCYFQTKVSDKERHIFHRFTLYLAFFNLIASIFTYVISHQLFTIMTDDGFFLYYFNIMLFVSIVIILWMMIRKIRYGVPQKRIDYHPTIIFRGAFKYPFMVILSTTNVVVVYGFFIFYGLERFSHDLLWLTMLLTLALPITTSIAYHTHLTYYATYALNME